MPTTAQLSLLLLATVLLAAGEVLSLLRLKDDRRQLRLAEKSCLYWGIVAAAGVLVWHGVSQGRMVPMSDNFDALVWLAVLLAGFVAYVQGTRPLAALEWFILPVVLAMLLGAAVVGRRDYHAFHPMVAATWSNVHHISSFAGAAAFAVAAAAGAAYVISSAKLRRKLPVGPALGSLERLEQLTISFGVLGFALLTIGIVTGMFELLDKGGSTPAVKIALALGVWVVYGIVLHAPASPLLRGRRAAVLSVLGFVLMIGVIATVESMR